MEVTTLPFEVIGPSYLDGKRISNEFAEILIIENMDQNPGLRLLIEESNDLRYEERFPM